MIKLSVDIDESLLESVGRAKSAQDEWSGIWSNYLRQHQLELPKNFTFVNLPYRLFADQVQKMRDQYLFLESQKQRSIKHIQRFLPHVKEDLEHHVRIVLLPFGTINYGPREGIQLYSFFPTADPMETYLFLIHVYYHEISFLNYTDRGRQVSDVQQTPDDYKEFLLLLIQNEGIANFAVYDGLMSFMDTVDRGYTYCYFNYAPKLNSSAELVKCMNVLNQVFSLDHENFMKYSQQIMKFVKSEQVPAINLIGLHIARKIADAFGVDVLCNVYKKEALEFFRLYFQTNDPIATYLSAIRERVFRAEK